MSTAVHRPTNPNPHQHVSFSPHTTSIINDDKNAFASSSTCSSPLPLIPASSSPTRHGLTEVSPLRASKIIPSSTRRAVIFSPRNDTKYFHSDDSIIASPTRNAPPPSIRTYHSDPTTPLDTPSSARGKAAQHAETPTLMRSILKARAEQIRLAASVEEGTLNNKEAARLLVSGKRPRMIKRDSFQLALMQKAASDGFTVAGDRKGKGRMTDEVPGSDDSTVSTDSMDKQEQPHVGSDGSSEEEEELEQDEALATASLIHIILDGAEDLLTLEEAYTTLVARLRDHIPTDAELAHSLPQVVLDSIRIATQPIRDEAPAIVRALQRDLQRLLGKLPHSENPSSDISSSPFRDLMPLRDDTPISETRNRFTPSPTPNPAGSRSSPSKPARQGYTEFEVRYRREAAGVGAAVLRFLAFTFCSCHLSSCFSDVDLQAILEQVMIIPRTPKLPTPNTKRTYYLSIFLLAQINIPAVCIQPMKEKIVRAIESALTDSLGLSGGLSGKEGPSATKKEGYHAVTHLVSKYPSIFFPYYADLLPACLRGLTSGSTLVRYKAGAAVCAFARGRLSTVADAQAQLLDRPDLVSRDAWNKAKITVQKSEFFVISHLKCALKLPGKTSPIYGKDGEKKTEWHSLDQVLKDGVGSTTEVHWACATWAAVVTLMGSAYGSSGLAVGLNHIMERSLAPSTNLYRPLLARIAWSHAIHAYLSAGFASSMTSGNELTRSYKPFAASSQLSIEERTKKIQMAFQIALPQAADPSFFARALVTSKSDGSQHYVWQRSEKAKKLQWLTTSCLGTTVVIYAYSGMAIYHEDQSAKDMTVISGLPSSDGVPIPDMTPEENRLPRLDNAWEKVVHPILKSTYEIRGVDRLTVNGWGILQAITSSSTTESQTWSLDRLLSLRYLSGELFTPKDKDSDFGDLLEDLETDCISPLEIPAWGQFWVAKRLGRLLVLFDEALSSVNGLNGPSSIAWIKNDHGVPLIPTVLSNIWSNLLQALSTVHLPNAPPTPLFLAGLQAITRQIIQVFNRDPKSYMPISRINEKGHCTLDEDEVRVGLTAHLYNSAIEILGVEILATLRLPSIPSEQVGASAAFGCDASGAATVSATMLGTILRTKILSLPLQPFVQSALKDLISGVLDTACAPGFAGKLLGDITNAMPWIFEESEEVQLDMWRLIATKWTEVIDIQPSSAAATSTNHTGALLVSLLSGPFRGRQITSFWHQRASQDDLAIWQALLKVTVLRFKAKRVGSNLGVLESLAGHLVDFLEQGEKTSSSTITLSCLASAISYISFVPAEHHHTSHWNINENYIPKDFLTLVSDALEESYPHLSDGETQEPTQTGVAISPAVRDVLDNLRNIFHTIPADFAMGFLRPLKAGLVMWLHDEEKAAPDAFAHELDQLYVTLLSAIGGAIEGGHILCTSETMNDLVEFYAPRLARAQSSEVPLAFQSFWQNTFGKTDTLDYSDDVAGFLRDLLAAVPGIIDVPGLMGDSRLSEEDSQNRFPHTLELRLSQVQPIPTEDIEMEVDVEHPLATGSYDADVSQDLTQTQIQELQADVTTETIVPPSPVIPEVEDDVFGPAATTRAKSKKGRKKAGKKAKGKGRAIPTKAVEEAQSLPELSSAKAVELDTTSNSLPSIKPETEEALVDDSDTDSDCIIVQPSPNYYRRRGMILPSPLRERVSESDSEPEIELVSKAGAEVEPEMEVPAQQLEEEEIQTEVEEQAVPFIFEEEDEDEEPSPTPTPTPTPSPKPITLPSPRQHREREREVQKETEVQVPSTTPTTDNRSSLLTSAKGWLSRVNSLNFFSPGLQPSQQVQSHSQSQSQSQDQAQSKKATRKSKRKAREIEEEELEEEPDLGTSLLRRTSSTDSVASVSSNTSGTTTRSKRKSLPVVDVPTRRASKRYRTGRSSTTSSRSRSYTPATAPAPAPEPVLAKRIGEDGEDEEDELLLSPESARKRTIEEEEGIRASQLVAIAQEVVEQTQSQSQSLSGRFDDAPNDPSPSPTTTPKRTRKSSTSAGLSNVPKAPVPVPNTAAVAVAGPSPMRRTYQQNQVLKMLEEATKNKQVIDSLDYAGVKSLLKNLNELRDAAEGRMIAKIEEMRSER